MMMIFLRDFEYLIINYNVIYHYKQQCGNWKVKITRANNIEDMSFNPPPPIQPLPLPPLPIFYYFLVTFVWCMLSWSVVQIELSFFIQKITGR